MRHRQRKRCYARSMQYCEKTETDRSGHLRTRAVFPSSKMVCRRTNHFRQLSLTYSHNLHSVTVVTLLLLSMGGKGHTGSSGDSRLPPGLLDSHLGRFDFGELEGVVYNMPVIAAHPVVETEVRDVGETSEDVESDQVIMVSKHGQRYSCMLPELPPALQEVKKSSDSDLDSATLPNISTLLEPMRNAPCIHMTEGWWTYEYCHGLYLKQYHLEGGKVVGKSLWLGFFDRETVWDQTQVDKVKSLLDSMKISVADGVPIAYHAAYYVNGTLCDITGKPRMTSARIYCGLGPDQIVEIREKETCNYTISIQSPRMCSHPLFKMEAGDKETHVIVCSPVLTPEDYEAYLLQQERKKSEEEQDSCLEDECEEELEAENRARTSEELKEVVFQSLSKLLELSSSLFDSGIGLSDLELDVDNTEVVDAKEGNSELRTGEDADTRADDVTPQSGSDHSGATGSAVDLEKGESAITSDSEDATTGATDSHPSRDGTSEGDRSSASEDSGIDATASSSSGSSSDNDDTETVDDDKDLEAAVNRLFMRLFKETSETESAGKVKAPATPWKGTQKPVSSSDQDQKDEQSERSRSDGSDVSPETQELPQNSDTTDFKTQLEEAVQRIKTKLPTEDRDHLAEDSDRTTLDLSANEGETSPSSRLGDVEGWDGERWDEETLHEVSEDLELKLQEKLNQAGIDVDAKVQLKVVKVPENMDIEEYADELAKELEDGEEMDEDLTPPVPSYLMKEEEREELSREERLQAFKHVTSNVADTLSQWLNTMEADSASVGDRQRQQKLESSYDQVWGKGDKRRKATGAR